jgi:hypothetical protein
MRTKLSKNNPLLQEHLKDETFSIKQKDFDDLLMKAAKPLKPSQKKPVQIKHRNTRVSVIVSKGIFINVCP